MALVKDADGGGGIEKVLLVRIRVTPMGRWPPKGQKFVIFTVYPLVTFLSYYLTGWNLYHSIGRPIVCIKGGQKKFVRVAQKKLRAQNRADPPYNGKTCRVASILRQLSLVYVEYAGK